MPWGKILAALTALCKALEPYLPTVTAFLAGREWQRTREAINELEHVDEAARAASRVDMLTADDVVRNLQERGLYHLSPESPNRE